MRHCYQVDLWEGVIVIPPAHRVKCFKVTAPATSSITFKALTAAPKITLIKLRMLMLVLSSDCPIFPPLFDCKDVLWFESAFSHHYQGRVDYNTVNTNWPKGELNPDTSQYTDGLMWKGFPTSTLHQNLRDNGISIPSIWSFPGSLGPQKIFLTRGTDFPILPSFWWSADIFHQPDHLINCLPTWRLANAGQPTPSCCSSVLTGGGSGQPVFVLLPKLVFFGWIFQLNLDDDNSLFQQQLPNTSEKTKHIYDNSVAYRVQIDDLSKGVDF